MFWLQNIPFDHTNDLTQSNCLIYNNFKIWVIKSNFSWAIFVLHRVTAQAMKNLFVFGVIQSL